MTDKQIIINGIDVRGCKNFRPDADTSEISYTNACSIGLWQKWYSNLEPSCIMSCRCRDNPNCHYKLYKRKEQECERFVEALKNKTDDYNKLAVNYDAYVSMANKQLKAKEQECERLKRQLTILDGEDVVVEITVKQLEEYKKLKQTLEEIKDFVENEMTQNGDTYIISQKINECEVEDATK